MAALVFRTAAAMTGLEDKIPHHLVKMKSSWSSMGHVTAEAVSGVMHRMNQVLVAIGSCGEARKGSPLEHWERIGVLLTA